nr:immunoglobulin heavy chain junction region [Mus musculus]MBK4197604.1 immunoglobulin heavy chain junction region [Mus musculus]
CAATGSLWYFDVW